ncbi:DUF3068 domain-containing protein [Oryzobacter sp. R7]|uniref:DUF3068 domain-containing protein n=1 Tax=Oryzobacter faecalis TaxID=3388656 RepID=UPI00398C974E
MRGVVTKLLVFIGAFLVAVAALAALWAPGQVKKTPLDVDSVTRLTGDAQISNGTSLDSIKVRATSTTHADSELSTDDVVLFQNSTCLLKDPTGDAPDCVSADDPEKRLVSAGTDTFAVDRRTAEAVADFENLPAEAEPKEGLVNKFPFDVEQRTYRFWDGYVGQAVDAVFQDAEDIDGLETYRFLITVTDGDIEITDGVAGKYSTEKTMWVDPRTGSIIDQNESQTRTVADTGDTFLQLDYGFTDETVAANVAAAKDNGSRLALLTSTVPLVGGLVGLVALAVGILLARTSRRSEDGRTTSPGRGGAVATAR